MSKPVCIIQARLGSTRFPRKILAPFNGSTVLGSVVERALQIHGVRVVVAVPYADWFEVSEALRPWPAVSVLAPIGNENDVLSRYRAVTRLMDAQTIMRVTGDCPCLNPIVADYVLEMFRDNACDCASNDTLVSGYPDGWDVEVFSRSALETATAQATDSADREHVTPWMRRNLRTMTLQALTPWTGPKLSIDVKEDLEVIQAWMQQQSTVA